MDADHLKAMIVASVIDQKQALYLRTKNPIHAWSAYHAARTCGVAIPEWVLSYFDQCSEQVTSATNNDQIAQAFGLAQRKGGRSKTRQARDDVRNFEIARRVIGDREPSRVTVIEAPKAVRAVIDALLKDAVNGQTALDVMLPIAEEYGLTVERVRDIYYEVIGPAKRA